MNNRGRAIAAVRAAIACAVAVLLVAGCSTLVEGRALSMLNDPFRVGDLPAADGPSGPRPNAPAPTGTVLNTNNGPIDPAGAAKATHFIQACCQSKTPILYLNNTTGFMVGKAYEEAGIIKHGSKMIQAVTNATVPQITIYCGASFGAGNYGMCGRGFHPRFCFSWPNAKTAVMGGEQAAQTMVNVTEAAMKRKGAEVDRDKLAELERRIIDRFDSQMSVFTTSAHLLDDGVIDPRDTREVLAQVLSICRDAELRQPQTMQFSVARP